MVSFGYLFHDSKRTPITDAYVVKETIGTGKFSIVKEGVEIATSKPCALKIMKKCVVQDNNLIKEVEIMRQLKHPNIISLQDIFETDTDLILVMDLVTGGELFDKIVERVSYTEEDAAKVVKQIASVLLYLHNKNIVHCDLKPENLLYSDTSADADIKLCDFGLSQVQVNNIPLTAILGTPTYMAPEIRACVGYGKPVDMWSLGVIVYILLCGFPPFDETTCILEFPSPEWDNISTSARDLITNLLVVDTTKRFNVQQAMSHLWVSGATAGKQSIAGALKTMRVFNTCRKSGTTFRGSNTSRASVFNIFPVEGDGVEKRDVERSSELEHYPAADSPAFFTIHNPLAALELETPPMQSPSLSSENEVPRGGSPLDFSPEKKDSAMRTLSYSSGSRWEGADSKEMLARELGMLLQANPQILRTLSEVSNGGGVGIGAGSFKSSLSNSGGASSAPQVSLEDLMNSLTAGVSDGDLVRPLSGHFTRIQHLEDQLRDTTHALETEREARCALEDAHSHVARQVTQAQDEVRRLEAYASVHQDQDLVDMARNLVNYMDGVIVNLGSGATTTRNDMRDTIEGLKEENATLDALYRQTKVELDTLIQEGGAGGYESLRKKNTQLTKELEALHKEYEALLHSKGGSDDTDESDEFFEDKKGRRKNKSGFLKRIIG